MPQAMGPPPQDFRKDDEVHPEDELYQPMSDDEPMDDADDSDMRSVGVVFKELDRGECEHATRCEKEILLAVRDLGGSRQAYKRERKDALRRIVSEIYSPPRVASAAKLLPSLKIIPGASMDITSRWTRKREHLGTSTSRQIVRRPGHCLKSKSLRY